MTIYKKEKIWYTLYRINSKKGKKYYVKARAFSLSNNKKVYGKWSKVKKI